MKHPRDKTIDRINKAAAKIAAEHPEAVAVSTPLLKAEIAKRAARAKAQSAAARAAAAEVNPDVKPISAKALKARKAQDHHSLFGYPEVTARCEAERKAAGYDD